MELVKVAPGRNAVAENHIDCRSCKVVGRSPPSLSSKAGSCSPGNLQPETTETALDTVASGLGKIFDAAKGDTVLFLYRRANDSQFIYRRIRLFVLYSRIIDEIVYK